MPQKKNPDALELIRGTRAHPRSLTLSKPMAMCAGSSLMPQKKNSDALELIRGTKAHPSP